jgi:acyl-coenzyme A synthetase/AMP-(fatty) acid ligase
VTTLSFDIAGLELFLPLMTGARVVVASREAAADGMRLQALLTESKATVMQATPATWRILLDAGWPGDRRLKVLCGGEALPRALANRLLDSCGELWNMYGPTETTIWSCAEKLEPGDGPVSIGRPIANTTAYVLDAQQQPVPAGVTGELYIGGTGVARGYRNRPELSAEKFIPDPFSSRPGARLYRTGDRVRYRPGGALEFLERLDHQVKIRGYRIEPGEIEAALETHPRIRESVVLACEDVPGDKRLVAYVVAAREPQPTTSELRGYLKEKLPEYMMPAAFIVMETLPRTPNGKVDRKALQGLRRGPKEFGSAYAAPRNPVEEALAGLWTEILGLKPVSIHDNFFDLGGHSLLAARMVARIRDVFQVDLPMRSLFEQTDLTEMAQMIETSLLRDTDSQELASILAELEGMPES